MPVAAKVNNLAPKFEKLTSVELERIVYDARFKRHGKDLTAQVQTILGNNGLAAAEITALTDEDINQLGHIAAKILMSRALQEPSVSFGNLLGFINHDSWNTMAQHCDDTRLDNTKLAISKLMYNAYLASKPTPSSMDSLRAVAAKQAAFYIIRHPGVSKANLYKIANQTFFVATSNFQHVDTITSKLDPAVIPELATAAATTLVLRAIATLDHNNAQHLHSLDTLIKAGANKSGDKFKAILPDNTWTTAFGISDLTILNKLDAKGIKQIIEASSVKRAAALTSQIDKFAPPNTKQHQAFREAYVTLIDDSAKRLALINLNPAEFNQALSVISTNTNKYQITQALTKLGFNNPAELAGKIEIENKRLLLLDKVFHKDLATHFKEQGLGYKADGSVENPVKVTKFINDSINSRFYNIVPGTAASPKAELHTINLDNDINFILDPNNMAPADRIYIPPACKLGAAGDNRFTFNGNAAANDKHQANKPILARIIEHSAQRIPISKNPALLKFMLNKPLVATAPPDDWTPARLEDFETAFNDAVADGSLAAFKRFKTDHVQPHITAGRINLTSVEQFMSDAEFRRLSYDRSGLMKDLPTSLTAINHLKTEVAKRFGKDGIELLGLKRSAKLSEMLDSLGGADQADSADQAYLQLLENLFNPALRETAVANANKWLELLNLAKKAVVEELDDYQMRLVEVEQRLAALPGANYFSRRIGENYGQVIGEIEGHIEELDRLKNNLFGVITLREKSLANLESLISKAHAVQNKKFGVGFSHGATWDMPLSDPSLKKENLGKTLAFTRTLTVGIDPSIQLKELDPIAHNNVRKHYYSPEECDAAKLKYRTDATPGAKDACDSNVNQGIFSESADNKVFKIHKPAHGEEQKNRLVFDMMAHVFTNLTEIKPLTISCSDQGEICRAIAAAQILMECSPQTFGVQSKWLSSDPVFANKLIAVDNFSIKDNYETIKEHYNFMKNDGQTKVLLDSFKANVADPKWNQSKQAASSIAEKAAANQPPEAKSRLSALFGGGKQKDYTPQSASQAFQEAKERINSIKEDKKELSNSIKAPGSRS